MWPGIGHPRASWNSWPGINHLSLNLFIVTCSAVASQAMHFGVSDLEVTDLRVTDLHVTDLTSDWSPRHGGKIEHLVQPLPLKHMSGCDLNLEFQISILWVSDLPVSDLQVSDFQVSDLEASDLEVSDLPVSDSEVTDFKRTTLESNFGVSVLLCRKSEFSLFYLWSLRWLIVSRSGLGEPVSMRIFTFSISCQ